MSCMDEKRTFAVVLEDEALAMAEDAIRLVVEDNVAGELAN